MPAGGKTSQPAKTGRLPSDLSRQSGAQVGILRGHQSAKRSPQRTQSFTRGPNRNLLGLRETLCPLWLNPGRFVGPRSAPTPPSPVEPPEFHCVSSRLRCWPEAETGNKKGGLPPPFLCPWFVRPSGAHAQIAHDALGRFAAFPDRRDHQVRAAHHVAAGEDLGVGGLAGELFALVDDHAVTVVHVDFELLEPVRRAGAEAEGDHHRGRRGSPLRCPGPARGAGGRVRRAGPGGW